MRPRGGCTEGSTGRFPPQGSSERYGEALSVLPGGLQARHEQESAPVAGMHHRGGMCSLLEFFEYCVHACVYIWVALCGCASVYEALFV